MPILPAEPALFPESLLHEAKPQEANGRDWWVLHTKPRQEKSLARQLHDRRIPYFLPLIARRLRIRRRTVQSHLPLFGGYLFLLADRDDRISALSTGRVVRSLAVAEQEQLWRDLRQICRLIDSGLPISPEDLLLPGTPVEIKSGPLAGLRGTIIRSVSGNRFLVCVDFIQRGASVLLDDVSLAKIDA